MLASGRVGAPQTWNRYAYALNNPLRLTDPSGMGPESPVVSEQDDPHKILRPLLAPEPTTPSRPPAPPPVDSSLAGSDEFAEENPLPTGITYGQGPVQVLNNKPVQYPDGTNSGDFTTGVVTVVDMNIVEEGGVIMTDSSGVTVTERITPDPAACNGPARQNTRETAPGATGSIPDEIGPARHSSQPYPRAGEALNYLYSRPLYCTVTQEVYVTAPNRGVVLYGVNRITFSNVDARGNVGPFTFTHTPQSTTSTIVTRQ